LDGNNLPEGISGHGKDILGQRFDELEWVEFIKKLTNEPSTGIMLMKKVKL